MLPPSLRSPYPSLRTPYPSLPTPYPSLPTPYPYLPPYPISLPISLPHIPTYLCLYARRCMYVWLLQIFYLLRPSNCYFQMSSYPCAFNMFHDIWYYFSCRKNKRGRPVGSKNKKRITCPAPTISTTESTDTILAPETVVPGKSADETGEPKLIKFSTMGHVSDSLWLYFSCDSFQSCSLYGARCSWWAASRTILYSMGYGF